MNEKQRNQQEWENPDNWAGPRWMGGFYSSDNDTRAMVPKRRPGLGWTPNFAHPGGRLFLVALLALVVIGMTLGIVLGGSS